MKVGRSSCNMDAPPFLVATPQRSPTMPRDLQLIQQAMVAQSNLEDAPFIPFVSKSQKKNNNHIMPNVRDIVANLDDHIDSNLLIHGA